MMFSRLKLICEMWDFYWLAIGFWVLKSHKFTQFPLPHCIRNPLGAARRAGVQIPPSPPRRMVLITIMRKPLESLAVFVFSEARFLLIFHVYKMATGGIRTPADKNRGLVSLMFQRCQLSFCFYSTNYERNKSNDQNDNPPRRGSSAERSAL